jgi:hypothetical protein
MIQDEWALRHVGKDNLGWVRSLSQGAYEDQAMKRGLAQG